MSDETLCDDVRKLIETYEARAASAAERAAELTDAGASMFQGGRQAAYETVVIDLEELVPPAPPTFESGTVYRSESTGELWLYLPFEEDGGDSYPWLKMAALTTTSRFWCRMDERPADLVACDIVPREVTS